MLLYNGTSFVPSNCCFTICISWQCRRPPYPDVNVGSLSGRSKLPKLPPCRRRQIVAKRVRCVVVHDTKQKTKTNEAGIVGPRRILRFSHRSRSRHSHTTHSMPVMSRRDGIMGMKVNRARDSGKWICSTGPKPLPIRSR